MICGIVGGIVGKTLEVGSEPDRHLRTSRPTSNRSSGPRYRPRMTVSTIGQVGRHRRIPRWYAKADRFVGVRRACGRSIVWVRTLDK